MHKVSAALAVTFVSAVQLPACSSSTHVTSLEPDKTLSSLTTEERRQYCEDRIHYMSSRVSADDRQKIHCAAAASDIGGDGAAETSRARAACQQVYQVCMSVPGPQQAQSSCGDFPASADGCMATVGEANDCAVAQADALQSLASRADATCKDLGRASEQGEDPASKASQACARVETLCPNLFEEPLLATGMAAGER